MTMETPMNDYEPRPGYARHPFMPDWVYEIPLFPVPPNTLDDVRIRIAGMAQKPHAEQFGEAARTLMTRLGTPGICPRRGCARAKQCSTPLAYCMFENLDAVQEFIFPLMKARLSKHTLE